MAHRWIHSTRQVAHTSLSHGSCIGCVSTPRQIEHSSSLITKSIWVAANGGRCMGFFIIGGGDTAIMCSTISAGIWPGFGPSILIDRHTTLEVL